MREIIEAKKVSFLGEKANFVSTERRREWGGKETLESVERRIFVLLDSCVEFCDLLAQDTYVVEEDSHSFGENYLLCVRV